jgi:hypothetical protein
MYCLMIVFLIVAFNLSTFLLEVLRRSSCRAIVTELFLRISIGFSAFVSALSSNKNCTSLVVFDFCDLYSYHERIVIKVIGSVVTSHSPAAVRF